jgi:DNA gyrase subunit A
LLINGSNGIAVGMATNIPPHNLTEVINAIVAVSKNEDITPEEIMENYLHGPDFPTGGIILGRSGIKKAYETGQGSIIIRSRTEIEELHNEKKRIVITEIPYQVNKATMVESIGRLARDKVIDGITAIRDESNKEGIRVVIELRKDVVAEVVLNQLFKNTQLQTSFGVIMLCLVNGEPKILPINKVLKHYLDFQCEVIERRTRFDLKKAKERLHIVKALIIALTNLDEVIEIIRKSHGKQESKQNLEKRFGFDDKQSEAIVMLNLYRLNSTDIEDIKQEGRDLEALIKRLITERGNKADLNDIDVSEITDMSVLFHKLDFNGDISNWDVSNVADMSWMFKESNFNGDISKWDVSNVTNMSWMFRDSKFNKDISKWDVSNVIKLNQMFLGAEFNQDISKWNLSSLRFMFDSDIKYIFKNCPIKEEYKPKIKF